MEIFAKKLQEQLERELNKVDPKNNAVKGYNHCFKLVKNAIDELKAYLLKHPFKDTATEIHYFKNIAPSFYSLYFYYVKLYDAALLRNSSKKEAFLLFLDGEEKEIEDFYHKYGEFCHYIYMDMSSHDEEYFTRGIPANWVQDDVAIIMDENFSLASYRLSRLKSYEEYKLFLEREKSGLEHNPFAEDNRRQARIYTWKGSNADATELVYAFKGKKLVEVNGREADIKDLAIMIKDFFGIELENIYDTHLHNRKRKRGQAPFLNSLIQVYIGSI